MGFKSEVTGHSDQNQFGALLLGSWCLRYHSVDEIQSRRVTWNYCVTEILSYGKKQDKKTAQQYHNIILSSLNSHQVKVELQQIKRILPGMCTSIGQYSVMLYDAVLQKKLSQVKFYWIQLWNVFPWDLKFMKFHCLHSSNWFLPPHHQQPLSAKAI